MSPTLTCWRCGASFEDEGARFCPVCGAPLAGSLTWWERFRRRPAWQQALPIVLVVAVAGILGIWALLPRLEQNVAQIPTIATSLPPPESTPQGEQPPQALEASLAVSPSATLPSASPTPAPSPSPTPTEDLHAALLDAAYRFQEAKAYSQRTGDISRLSEDLQGDALQKQIELVERWRDQGCYWEITLNAPLTLEILEIREDGSVLVRVDKVETRLLYCDGALESETHNDAYSTTYVMQKISGKWYVTQRE